MWIGIKCPATAKSLGYESNIDDTNYYYETKYNKVNITPNNPIMYTCPICRKTLIIEVFSPLKHSESMNDFRDAKLKTVFSFSAIIISYLVIILTPNPTSTLPGFIQALLLIVLFIGGPLGTISGLLGMWNGKRLYDVQIIDYATGQLDLGTVGNPMWNEQKKTGNIIPFPIPGHAPLQLDDQPIRRAFLRDKNISRKKDEKSEYNYLYKYKSEGGAIPEYKSEDNELIHFGKGEQTHESTDVEHVKIDEPSYETLQEDWKRLTDRTDYFPYEAMTNEAMTRKKKIRSIITKHTKKAVQIASNGKIKPIDKINSKKQIDVELLSKKGDVDGLIDAMMHDTDTKVRKDAARALEKVKDNRIIEPLIQVLKEEKDDDVRWNAAIALSTIGGEQAVEPFKEALADKSKGVRRNAAFFLLGRWERDAMERIAGLIDDKELASYSIQALEKLGDADHLIQIMKNHSDANVRDDAMMALTRLRDPRLVEILISVLKDDTTESPGRVAVALRELGDKKAVPYLVEIVENAKIISSGVDAITPTVYWAINSLGNLGDSSHIPLLENLKRKIMDRGLRKKYVDAGNVRGWRSTEDEIREIDAAIAKLKIA